ncbi:MAG TPA: tRNA preQ1(34) S-adenosylmethionine ribosyltransferase-isomerase QueA [Thermodesulfobacteriota bacterium]|nr:tRNA preQ1(34) S-adenosylmethionine ribosyltransferase-isomerase QueA [Thermodesulfobacteriota bacterium]
MKLSDFEYLLPPHLVAQAPPEARGRSRLMVLDREKPSIEDVFFRSLPDYLQTGDVLVVNDTRVIPARLIGRKATGGTVRVLLVRRKERRPKFEAWDCLVQGSGKMAGRIPLLLDPALRCELSDRRGDGLWTLSAEATGEEDAGHALRRIGFAPLPPYIRRNGDDALRGRDLERYQTVYANSEGAIAAPTAGLHFTEGLLEEMRRKGVVVEALTLHVGRGTFLPVKREDIENHRLEGEAFEIPARTAEAVNRARDAGRRVFAVGTTVTRALESAADDAGRVAAVRGETDLFIVPGHRFRAVDALITNFHLPGSTLVMLVAAFAGRERILSAYDEAIRREYRFYSYGDAMLIL